jgi:hypothetical protein
MWEVQFLTIRMLRQFKFTYSLSPLSFTSARFKWVFPVTWSPALNIWVPGVIH